MILTALAILALFVLLGYVVGTKITKNETIALIFYIVGAILCIWVLAGGGPHFIAR